MAPSLASIKEEHHYYPLLLYFRFEDPLYAVSRFCFVLLDLVTLIETALDERRFGSLAHSAPVTTLRQGALLLLTIVARNFPTGPSEPADAVRDSRARQSYAAAIARLGSDCIPARPDGADLYVAKRREWDPLVRRVAPILGYRMEEIDRRRPQDRSANPGA